MHRILATFVLVGLVSPASAAPAPRRPIRPVITIENVGQLRPVSVVPRDVWRIVWGPQTGEASFLSWESPVEVYDDRAFRPLRRLAADKKGVGAKTVQFAVAPDRETVAFGENGTRIEIRNLRHGTSVTIETGNDQPTPAFSPRGKWLATGGYGTKVRLWDVQTGKPVRVFDAGKKGGLQPVFSPDGSVLAVGNRNDSTRLYEAATGKLLHVLDRGMTQELTFSPDGRVLAAGYVNGLVCLWDVAEGRLLGAVASGAEEVYTLDFCPRGDVLAAAGRMGTITLWNPKTLEVVKSLDAPEWVIQVRFSPDGTRLLSAGGGTTPGPERKTTVWGVSEK